MALCGTGSTDVNCLCGLGRVNQGSIFAATIRTAEPPTLSDQAGVRVLDARIAGIVSPDSLAQKKQQRQRHTHHFANTAAWSSFKKQWA